MLRRTLALVAVTATTLTVVAGAPSVASAQTPNVVIDGGGWGHGRGLSQWGSLGYAIGDYGDGVPRAPWSSAQILNHYYGGTTAGSVSPAQAISVDIQRHVDQALAVQVSSGAVQVAAPGGAVLRSASAVRVVRVNGAWTIQTSTSCSGGWTTVANSAEPYLRVLPPAASPSSFSYGAPGDLPVTGDWEGDGVDTVAVARPDTTNGTLIWYLRSTTGGTSAQFAYGAVGDIPVAGDWDGDGRDGIGVFRPSPAGGSFHLRETASGVGAVAVHQGFGSGRPLTGDWDDDGRDGVAVVDMPTWRVWNDPASPGSYNVFGYGLETDVPVAGDWNGDGRDSPGARRGAQWFLRNTVGSGNADITTTALASGGTPLAGRWTGTPADALGRHDANSWQLQIGADDLPRTLQLCHAGGFDGAGPLYSSNPRDTRYYRGELRAIVHAGRVRTSNVVAIDDYLRGVVPRESPAYWGGLGACSGGRCTGMSQLEAQSVAARSYALGENRNSSWGSQTCDTTSCQVYGGRARRTNGGNASVLEHPNTDGAIQATAGVIRRTTAGAPARTEFSSSSGGYTAGGQFPAVPDLGDGIDDNPNHTWRVTMTPSAVVAALGIGGTLQQARVTARTPADGGRRAQTVTFVTSAGTYTRTGDQVRQALGLKSTYFTITFGTAPPPPPPPPPPPADGLGMLVRRSNQFLIRQASTPGPATITTAYGVATDVPLVGDWNGDGTTDIGVFRGGQFLLRVGLTPGPPTHAFSFGRAGDVPLAGDWNGDGTTDIGVRRGNTWYLRNTLSAGPADVTTSFGASTDVPVVGDWNGDGFDTPGVWRSGTFYLRDALASGAANRTFAGPSATGRPIAFDWDGDGKAEVGTYTNGSFRMLGENAAGQGVFQVNYGAASDIGLLGWFGP